MKQTSKKITAGVLCTMMLMGSVSALDISMDNYYEVAMEHSVAIQTSTAMDKALIEDRNRYPDGQGGTFALAYSGAELMSKEMTDMQKKGQNAQSPFDVGSTLITYYTLEQSYGELTSNITMLERNMTLMEKLVSLGMKSELDLLEMKNSYHDLINKKINLQANITSLKNSLALSLGVSVETLNIGGIKPYTKAEIGSLKELLEKKYNINQAVQTNYNLKMKRYEQSLKGNKQYNAMMKEIKNLEQTLKDAYDSAFADMMNKYDSLVLVNSIYDKKKVDFEMIQKKYTLGLVSKVDLEIATIQKGMEEEKIESAIIALKQAELKIDAFHNGVWLMGQ